MCRLVPTVATSTFCPAATFGAPHTICTGSPSPRSTRDAQSVGIGVFAALQHMAHHHAGQHTLDGLMQLHALGLQAGAGEDRSPPAAG